MKIVDWGLIDYASALNQQVDLVDLVSRELSRETLVFCTHPPVVTLGRGTLPGDVDGWAGEIIEVNRGGRATYHGPSQIVVYPILDLNSRGRDLHRHMRALENAVVTAVAEFGLQAAGRALSDDGVDATGVWLGARKLASVGIGVRKWVSCHGLALNVSYDAHAFQGLKPCGFTPATMISMEEALGRPVDRGAVQKILAQELMSALATGIEVSSDQGTDPDLTSSQY